MSAPHTECGRAGKYDCPFDESVFRAFGDEGSSGEGDVQAPCAWFAEFDLNPGTEPGYAEHYGGKHLVLRELNDGRCFVEVYDTTNAQEERLELLRAAYEEWDLSALTEYPNLDLPR